MSSVSRNVIKPPLFKASTLVTSPVMRPKTHPSQLRFTKRTKTMIGRMQIVPSKV